MNRIKIKKYDKYQVRYLLNEREVYPEISIKIQSIPIKSTGRKLKFNWCPELASDIKAYHGIDIEKDLTELMSSEIAKEFDKDVEILAFLKKSV